MVTCRLKLEPDRPSPTAPIARLVHIPFGTGSRIGQPAELICLLLCTSRDEWKQASRLALVQQQTDRHPRPRSCDWSISHSGQDPGSGNPRNSSGSCLARPVETSGTCLPAIGVMPPKAATIPNGSARFTHRVLAVFPGQPNRTNEQGDTGQSSLGLMHQFVTLDASFDPSASILFRFSLVVSNGIPLYLQILPDRVASFERISHDSAHRDPGLDIVRNELDGVRRLVCLRFRLYKAGHLITPVGFEIDRSDAEALHNFNSITSLAAALDFCVYMRPDVLTKSKFAVFHNAIKEPRDAAQIAALEWRADPSRLYNGKGGEVVTQGAESVSSPASCASTVAVDSPPGYRLQSHDVASLAPPAYQQAHQHVAPPVEELGKRLRSSSKSADSRPSKRVGPQSSSPHVTFFGPQDELQTRQIQEFTAIFDSRVHSLLEQYQRRIDKLEDSVRILSAKNEQLEAQGIQQQQDIQMLRDEVKVLQEEGDKCLGRTGSLEERQDEFERRQEDFEDSQALLEQRQDATEETVELTDVRILGLEGLLDEDWRCELVDEVRGESVAGVREFLRNI
ncbi:hypothetical protein BKA67DRAFT_540679 [Truncatella angustata]|uniref:Uncharacterized protein n=1 Tax=Truncatella angustata TaxID=152316 RepID=A0A9P8RJX9_9PEZI|nr:uncharacterized protein BKA67DRAFT_540679 [Truncatella angustata]KAH6647232.1 hypothetical protein BKA67DRAFT_540679 [Truncatella angustata]